MDIKGRPAKRIAVVTGAGFELKLQHVEGDNEIVAVLDDGVEDVAQFALGRATVAKLAAALDMQVDDGA